MMPIAKTISRRRGICTRHLDADERAQVETMMSVDKDFAADCRCVGDKLSVLNQMVGSVEPRDEVWTRSRNGRTLRKPQAPLVLPQAPRRSRLRSGSLRVVDTSNVIRLSAQARPLGNVASFTTADRGSAGRDDRVGVYQPDFTSRWRSSEPRVQVVEVKTPPCRAPSAQYVAVLQKEGGSRRSCLTVDGQPRIFNRSHGGRGPEPARASSCG